jgi:hypothetical protein
MKAVVAAREPLYKEIETFVGLREKAFQRFIGAIPILPLQGVPCRAVSCLIMQEAL